jgi:hypothetical protein
LKTALASHPDIASLEGEIEPFLALTKNGFGHTSESDAIHVLSNKSELADNIFDDLTIPSSECASPEQLESKWRKRCLLQFPVLFSERAGYQQLLQSLRESMMELAAEDIREENESQNIILSKIFRREPWRISYYDNQSSVGVSNCFDEAVKIEEPPFVVPRHYRRPFTKEDIGSKLLLFKTPPDAYRIGMYERIFPNANIKYIHLTRGYAQTVNGLIDGWLSPVGFFSHDLGRVGLRLDIQGYSDVVQFGSRWWKFDLPPNWRNFVNARLEDVCLNQWMSTHNAVHTSGVRALQIRFEDFLLAPASVAKSITDYLGVSEFATLPALPVTMATDTPTVKRWKKRSDVLLQLGERKEVRDMMDQLGYKMNPETWL